MGMFNSRRCAFYKTEMLIMQKSDASNAAQWTDGRGNSGNGSRIWCPVALSLPKIFTNTVAFRETKRIVP